MDVDVNVILADPRVRSWFRRALSRRIEENRTLFRTMPLATRTAETASSATHDILPLSPLTRRGTRVCPVSAFSLLRGFEMSVLKLVADFAGVSYGRPLSNLRRVLQMNKGINRGTR